MASRSLNSDHLNYLIWRYLQESGYGEAAVKLQRDWKSEPQGLPFAPHIKTHALVSLVQKGLLYHEVESSIDKSLLSSLSLSVPQPFDSLITHNCPPIPQRGNPTAGPTEGFFSIGSGNNHQNNLALPTAPVAVQAATANSTPHSTAGPVATANTIISNNNAAAAGQNNGMVAVLPAPQVQPESQASSAAPSPRKHPRDRDSLAATPPLPPSLATDMMLDPPQPATKRPRKSHDAENGLPAAANGDPMQLDSHRQQMPVNLENLDTSTSLAPAVQRFSADENYSRDASPHLVLEPITNGSSVGVQVDKVADVGAETVQLLHTPRGSVLHAHWHPHDPSLLVTAGTDALARIWKIPSTHAPDQQPSSVDLELDLSDNSYLTAVAWNPSGDIIALVPREPGQDQDHQILLHTKANGFLASVPIGPELLLKLKWSRPKGTYLLGAASSISSQMGTIHLWTHPETKIEDTTVDGLIIDVAWVSEDVFTVCTSKAITEFRISDNRALPFSSIDLPPDPDSDDSFEIMRYDFHTGLMVLGTEHGDLYIFRAPNFLHRVRLGNSITSLEWQPSPPTSANEPRVLALATSAGTLQLVNALPPYQIIHSLLPPSDFPAQDMAFTPDGFAIAAKSADRVLVWAVASGGLPKAKWLWPETPKKEDSDSDSGLNETVSLDWDALGRRLVVAEDQSIAIVKFGR
ncbi:MAG: hypothetical protein M1814_000795 [Vezdaea aestivalis]|nr:MAG: hypothetical protein M1814_000795 [Vezdaea aestivalis]